MTLSPKNTASIGRIIAELDAEEKLVLDKIASAESTMANARLDVANAKTDISVYREDLAEIRAQRAELKAAIA